MKNEPCLFGVRLTDSLCFIGVPYARKQKKLKAQRFSPLGLKLAEEEHEQKDDDLHQLLVAQLKLDCQLEHGNSPVCAGSAANLSTVTNRNGVCCIFGQAA